MFRGFDFIRKLFISRRKGLYPILYRILGFYPNNVHLFEQAFTHRSSSVVTTERQNHNERLEFLGDAIMDAVVADIIFRSFPDRKEGFMTNTRSKIVQRDSLHYLAIQLGLDKLILTSKINSHNNYVYGNAFEALVGAVFLDQGYERCYEFVKRVLDRYLPLNKVVHKEVNFKSSLIEWSQKIKLEIVFDLIETYVGQEGSPVFQSQVTLEGKPLGTGIGYSKKESQQAAAKMAIRKIRRDRDVQRFINTLKSKKYTSGLIGERAFSDLPPEVDSRTPKAKSR